MEMFMEWSLATINARFVEIEQAPTMPSREHFVSVGGNFLN
jgi:hypothetical protein